MTRMSAGCALSGPPLFSCVREEFKKVRDFRDPARVEIPIEDFFMSGLAVYSLKLPSLLQFDEQVRQQRGFSGLSKLFSISRPPSDTHMRTVLDEYDCSVFRPAYKALFEKAQRAKVLEEFAIWDNTYCLAPDGTGYFSSDTVHCDNCQEKTYKATGEVSYYHQMLCASIVHPDKNTVIPVCPEPIRKQDGTNKNDCEQNAMRRFLTSFREDHPKLKVVLLADALHSTVPCLELIDKLGMEFILAVKPGSHEKLFLGLDQRESHGQVYHFEEEFEIGNKVKKKQTKHYRFINGVLLNHQNVKRTVNFLEYWETIQWVDQWGETQEEKTHFSWVTSYSLYKDSAKQIVRAGRTRWKIENETFNALKNQGYEFEHNFGHGYKNLNVNMAHLMLLAFLIDQLQEMRCRVFQAALDKVFNRRSRLWQRVKATYKVVPIEFSDWLEFLSFIVDPRPWFKEAAPS